jgi:hypothetical protein
VGIRRIDRGPREFEGYGGIQRIPGYRNPLFFPWIFNKNL